MGSNPISSTKMLIGPLEHGELVHKSRMAVFLHQTRANECCQLAGHAARITETFGNSFPIRFNRIGDRVARYSPITRGKTSGDLSRKEFALNAQFG